MCRSIKCVVLIVLTLCVSAQAQTDKNKSRVAVLDFGETHIGAMAAKSFARRVSESDELRPIDLDEVRAAARGAGYAGSMNMTISEARDLGSALGCDFFVVGDSQTLRRSPSTGAVYFESYASIFIVSARTGRLVHWERPNFRAASPEDAEGLLLAELAIRSKRYVAEIVSAASNERNKRESLLGRDLPVLEELPDEESPSAKGLRIPLPYRRLQPAYTDEAAALDVVAVVDVEVDLDKKGEIQRAEVVRWAGYGLDESALATVRQLHFRPAMRDGVAIPMRVLLRYNFRKPSR